MRARVGKHAKPSETLVVKTKAGRIVRVSRDPKPLEKPLFKMKGGSSPSKELQVKLLIAMHGQGAR